MTINRPEVLNALNIDMLQRLSDLLDALKARESVRAVILTGAGSAAFSAGADIRYLHSATPLEVREYARLAGRITFRNSRNSCGAFNPRTATHAKCA